MISRSQFHLLKNLSVGALVAHGERAFPFPFGYRDHTHRQRTDGYIERLVVARLVEAKRIEHKPGACDRIDFYLTRHGYVSAEQRRKWENAQAALRRKARA